MNTDYMVGVPNAPGYFVTQKGEVYSTQTNWRGYGERKLLASPNSDGYLRVRVVTGRERKALFIHKLVALIWLPARPSPVHELRHLDGDKTNNHVSNLAWGTRQDNANDRDRHGRTATGMRNGAAKLGPGDAGRIRYLYRQGISQQKLGGLFGVNQKTVSNVVRGVTWK